MSFGGSYSDVITPLGALGKLASILGREALDSFQRCAESYKSFMTVARRINSFIEEIGLPDDDDFRSTQRNIETLLQRYFGRIEAFQEHLGLGRVRKSPRTAVAKIRWHQHGTMLQELRKDLDRQINVVNILINTTTR